MGIEWERYLQHVPAFDPRRVSALARRVGITLPAAYLKDLREHAGQVIADDVEVRYGGATSGFGSLLYVVGSACFDLPTTKRARAFIERKREDEPKRNVRGLTDAQRAHISDSYSVEFYLKSLAEWHREFPAMGNKSFWPISSFSSPMVLCLMAPRGSTRAPSVVMVDRWAEADEGEDPVFPVAKSYPKLMASFV